MLGQQLGKKDSPGSFIHPNAKAIHTATILICVGNEFWVVSFIDNWMKRKGGTDDVVPVISQGWRKRNRCHVI